MNHCNTRSSVFFCSLLATGCATHTLKQTKQVSDSAGTYIAHVNDLLDKTKEQVIDMDSKILVSSRSVNSREENEKKLKENNEVLEEWIATADQLREQNNLLLSYFTSLQQLMAAPGENDMTQPLSGISLLISQSNQLNAERRGRANQSVELSQAEADSLGDLGQLAVSNYYAGKVRQVLKRDGKIIDKQIELQAQQFASISKIYKRRTRFLMRTHYANKVRGAYVDVKDGQFMPENWMSDRRQWLDRKQYLIEFDKIKKANLAFRKDWRNLVQGKKDISAVAAILGETSQGWGTAVRFYDSRRYPAQSYTPPFDANISIAPQQ